MLSEHVMALHAQHSGSGSSSRGALSLRTNSRRTHMVWTLYIEGYLFQFACPKREDPPFPSPSAQRVM